MTTHEVLVRARAMIERPAMWQKKWGLIGSGPHCTLSAIGEAEGHNCVRMSSPAYAAISEATGANSQVGLWNDAPERTHAEVLAAFDKAIAATAPAPDLSFLASSSPETLATPRHPVEA